MMGNAESALPLMWVPVIAAPAGIPSAAAAFRGNGVSAPVTTAATAADRNSREGLRACVDDESG